VELEAGVNLAEARVLVVEDNELNQEFARAVLASMGVSMIECAGNGVEALAQLGVFEPDLIILDLMMPVMDGQEFLTRLRALPQYADLPVLVTTALGAQKMRNATFANGATDFIEKPIHRKELVARVTVHLRSHLLLKSLRRYHDRLAQDLETAKAMQEALLPTAPEMRDVMQRYGVFVDALFAPSSELGGDLWGLTEIDDHRLGLFAIDFSGHGVAAAINTFRLHLLMSGAAGEIEDPAAFLRRLNAALMPVLPRGQFATMVVAVLDLSTRQLTIANAGAPAPIIGIGADLYLLPERALPLGISRDVTYANRVVPFPIGSHLSLYSDGLTDNLDTTGAAVAEAGVLSLLADSIEGERAGLLTRLMRRFAQHSPAQPEDDLTFIWLAS
jgi:sigma-B regulation protein RsbU (phosphoserine phosphatase)